MTAQEWIDSLRTFDGFPRLSLGWPLEEHGVVSDEERAYEEYVEEYVEEFGDTPYSFKEWKTRIRDPQIEEIEASGDGGFSWEECDLCGNGLGGLRYSATALPDNPKENQDYIALSICGDCLQFIAYGEVPDFTEKE